MSTIHKFNINNREYLFVNDFINTRNGFAHRSTLYCDNEEIGVARVSYLNRTWERYTYQTSMRSCVNKIMQFTLDYDLAQVKEYLGLSRWTKELKDKETAKIMAYREMIDLAELLKYI